MPLTSLRNLTKSRSLNMAPLLDACRVYGGCLPPQNLWLHRQARLHHSQGFVSTRYNTVCVAQLLTGCTNPSHSASSGACLLPPHVFCLFSPTIMHNLETPFGQDRMELDKWIHAAWLCQGCLADVGLSQPTLLPLPQPTRLQTAMM
jgi:hypothetical protein